MYITSLCICVLKLAKQRDKTEIEEKIEERDKIKNYKNQLKIGDISLVEEIKLETSQTNRQLEEIRMTLESKINFHRNVLQESKSLYLFICFFCLIETEIISDQTPN